MAVGTWRVLGGGNVVDMVAESDKEIKEQLRASVVHLELHGSAALEGTARADDEGEIVGSQLGVCVGSVGVGVSSRSEDGAALDTRLESLFAKCQLLQLIQSILFSRTVNDSILEKITVHATMIDGALDGSTLFFSRGLNLPRVASLVVHQTRVVVTLVEILEDRAKDLGLLVGKGDALGGGVHVPVSKSVAEEGAAAEDVFVSCKEALFSTDDESDDGRSQVVSHNGVIAGCGCRSRGRSPMARLMSSLGDTAVLAERRAGLVDLVALGEALARGFMSSG